MINVSWARDEYGVGLWVYHVFCDSHSIPEEERCLAFLIALILSCTRLYAGRTLANYVFAI